MTDHEFLRAFANQTLRKADWTHRAHVRVAYLLLTQCGIHVTATLLRHGIRALNRRHGVLNGPHSGYHETITMAWLQLVRSAMERTGPAENFTAFIEANPDLLTKKVLALHYSGDLLRSPAARAEFVAPDRVPMPTDGLGLRELAS